MHRLFLLGGDWLYLKIYVGQESMDRLLLEQILPLSEELMISEIISEFFFIRYEDSFGSHIRVRFHLSNPSLIIHTISEVNRRFKPLIDTRRISNLMYDIYRRELERYGRSNYPYTESLFCIDSFFQLQLISIINKYAVDNYRWMIGLVLVDDLLCIFNIKDEQYLSFVEKHRDAFRQEFQCMGKQIYQKHNEHYWKNRIDVDRALQRSFPADIVSLINERQKRISNIYSFMTWTSEDTSQESYLGSIIHMTVNRFFENSARVCEMVIYEFLFKHKRSELSRNSSLGFQ